MSQGRPALAFEVRRASPSESPQALADRALALVDAGADALVVSNPWQSLHFPGPG
jgi:hypothetical protein